MRKSFPVVAALVFLSCGSLTADPITTVGVYDEQVVQLNAVDLQPAGNQISLAQFTADVAAAYAANLGGVIDFDNAATGTVLTDPLVPITSFNAEYGVSKSKSLTITNPQAQKLIVAQNPSMGRTPISDSKVISVGLYGQSRDYAFSFNPNDFVTAVGMTLLPRMDAWYTASGNVTYSNNSVAYIGSIVIDDQLNNDLADTFFGFKAPQGLSITNVWVHIVPSDADVEGAGAYTSLDDLGFVTGVIPEPATVCLLGVGVAGIAAWRRRAAK